MPSFLQRCPLMSSRRSSWRRCTVALGCTAALLSLQPVDAADDVDHMTARVSQPPAKMVRVTSHAVPSVVPVNGQGHEERTFLDLLTSWLGIVGQDEDAQPAVKVEPQDVDTPSELVVVPDDGERDAIVPIDPSPKPAPAPALAEPSLGQARLATTTIQPPVDPEPLGVLTMRLVSTSLVSASLWGKTVSAEDQDDDLDRFASVASRRLDRPFFPVSRRLLDRARPPLKAGRIITTEEGAGFLTPIEPEAASPAQ
ncbi:MAG TPA: hypothetical protein VHL31_11245 [Geminicoccus sp.]|uniref:hypothetical protein n=1 Tax=Geminicoccus sp. TaxID=2024832 RepID=UPI002E339692|nr:hypothetical protein [Geminicoccus sp.]HEX2526855.1 hypothetical protein [Geminicoccus sp.]